MNSNYWNDYSFFIKRSEELTNHSPYYLIEIWENLVNQILNNEYTDCPQELDNELNVREQINKILTDTSLNNNLLLDPFKQSLISADKKAKSSLEEKHKWANKDLKNSFKEFVNRIIE